MCGFVAQAAYVSNCDLLYKLIKVNAKIQCHLNEFLTCLVTSVKSKASITFFFFLFLRYREEFLVI